MSSPTENKNQDSPLSPAEPWQSNWIAEKTLKDDNQSLVRLARSPDGNRIAVLKTLKEFGDTNRRYRLSKEVLALERLRGNKGIPNVLDHNAADVQNKERPLFLVIERVEGLTLADRFHKPFGLQESLTLTIKICELVRLCHQSNVVHRDIKPDNIIVNPETGDVSLIDFGEAWTEDIITSLQTHINQELGNRFLRLPEMMSGSETKDDPRSDLTFVCGVLFWLLTQKKPIQLLNEQLKAPHYAMADRFPAAVISDKRWPFVQSIFDVGFSPGIHQRFQTADDLLSKLNEALKPKFVESTAAERAKQELAKLDDFYRRAEVAAQDAIDKGMIEASDSLLRELYNLARTNHLWFNSTALGGGNRYNRTFRFILRYREPDPIFVEVSHWIRLVGPNRATNGERSYVEACFDYVTFAPAEANFPEPYHSGPASDTRRLKSEVQRKADFIFAELLTRLRQRHEEQYNKPEQ